VRPISLGEVPVGANIPVPSGSATEKSQTRRALAGHAGRVVGELGVANAYRQPEDLIAVVEAILPGGKFVCMGGLGDAEPRAQQIRALVEKRGLAAHVAWTGFLPMHELACALAVVDVYVHSSKRGASTRSTAMVSALAHGLPIVAYRGPETPAYLKHGENIFLVDQGDSSQFGAAVRELLSDADLRRHIGAGARSVYECRMTWAHIADQVLAS
jgi:glycosyltransferase involved in cell wall biosynthesis